MKRYEEMSDDELLALYEDDERFARVVDYECAQEGVQLLPAEPVAPGPAEAKPDQVLWRVHLDVLLEDRSAAHDLCAMIDEWRGSFREPCSLGSRYDYNAPSTSAERDVDAGPAALPERTRFWSRDHYASHKAELIRCREDKADYDRARKAHDSIAQERAGVERSVRGMVLDAVQRRDDREKAQAEFARYVDLAEGDRDMAFRFYAKAYPDHAEEWAREVLGVPSEKVAAAEEA